MRYAAQWAIEIRVDEITTRNQKKIKRNMDSKVTARHTRIVENREEKKATTKRRRRRRRRHGKFVVSR